MLSIARGSQWLGLTAAGRIDTPRSLLQPHICTHSRDRFGDIIVQIDASKPVVS